MRGSYSTPREVPDREPTPAGGDGAFTFSWEVYGDTKSTGVVSLANLAMVESQSVDNNVDLRARRTFQVAAEVAPDGLVYMPAHIKIVRRGGQAPRLHFYDDAGGLTGRVHVGYIGEHLPTAKHAH